MSGIDSDLIRGHIDTIILKTLFDGDKYGYEILDEVAKKSGGAYELKQPTLYSCLKRLEGQGLISSYWVDSEIGGKRHYYCLTDNGKETYIQNQKDWLRSRQIIDNLIWEEATHLPDHEIITEKPENSNTVENVDEKNETPTNTDNSSSDETKTEDSPAPILEQNESSAEDNTPHQDEVSQSENDSDESTDIMQLLGHYDFQNTTSQVDESTQKLDEASDDLNKAEENYTNSFLESFAKHYLSEEIQEKTEDQAFENVNDELPEITDDFNIDMDSYLNSENNFFESKEMKDKTNFITPNIITDGYESQNQISFVSDVESDDDKIITNFDDLFESHTTQEEITSQENIDQSESQDDDLTPSYYSFGEEITRHYDDTAMAEVNEDDLVDTSFIDLDSLYITTEHSTEEPQEQLQHEEINEIDNTANSFESEFVTSPFLNEEPVIDQPQTTKTVSTETTTNNIYSPQGFETIAPKYTDEVYKQRLNELTAFAKESTVVEHDQKIIDDEILFDTKSFMERNKSCKNYDNLISDFEREGLQVRVHSKLVKETKESKTYVQTNKIKMTRNWISFCFITALLAVVYACMCPDGENFYDFSYKYFLIGALVALLIPVTSTIIYAINPYKKHVAQYSPGVSLLLSVLIFAQLLTIIYCINLQLGFFSFTQQYYNHLFWIIPMIISIYPILNSVVYMTLYSSKNFHA